MYVVAMMAARTRAISKPMASRIHDGRSLPAAAFACETGPAPEPFDAVSDAGTPASPLDADLADQSVISVSSGRLTGETKRLGAKTYPPERVSRVGEPGTRRLGELPSREGRRQPSAPPRPGWISATDPRSLPGWDGAGAPGGASQGRSPARGAPDAALIKYGSIRQRGGLDRRTRQEDSLFLGPVVT